MRGIDKSKDLHFIHVLVHTVYTLRALVVYEHTVAPIDAHHTVSESQLVDRLMVLSTIQVYSQVAVGR